MNSLWTFVLIIGFLAGALLLVVGVSGEAEEPELPAAKVPLTRFLEDAEDVLSESTETVLSGFDWVSDQIQGDGSEPAIEFDPMVGDSFEDDSAIDDQSAAIPEPVEAAAESGEFEICHVASETNQAQRTTIVVSERSLSGHLAHGDLLGPCSG